MPAARGARARRPRGRLPARGAPEQLVAQRARGGAQRVALRAAASPAPAPPAPARARAAGAGSARPTPPRRTPGSAARAPPARPPARRSRRRSTRSVAERALRLERGARGRHPALDRLAPRPASSRSRAGTCVPPVAPADAERRVDHDGARPRRRRARRGRSAPRGTAAPALDRVRVLQRAVDPAPRSLPPITDAAAAAERRARQRSAPKPVAPLGERRGSRTAPRRAAPSRRRPSRPAIAGCWPSAHASALDAGAVGADHEHRPRRPPCAPASAGGAGARRRASRRPAARQRGPGEMAQPHRRRVRAAARGRARSPAADAARRCVRARSHSISITRLRSGDCRPVAGAVVSEPCADAAEVAVSGMLATSRDEAGAAQELRVAAEAQPRREAAQLHQQVARHEARRMQQRERGRLLGELRVDVERPRDRRDLRLVAEDADLLRADQLGAGPLGGRSSCSSRSGADQSSASWNR